MKGILFLSWFLGYFLPVVLALENPTPTTDWYNFSPDDAHQKESLANGWFKYPSGHWGRKFNYGRSSAPPLSEPTLVRPYASFYLLTYLVGYYLLGQFSSMFRRFDYLGQLGHLAMVTVPIGLVITGLNVGGLAHQLGIIVKINNFLPLKTQGQEQDLNPEPVHPRFSRIEPPQAQAKPNFQNENTSKNLRATAPEEEPDNLPNRGGMKSIQVANQNPLPEENTGLSPILMTMTQEQKGRANLPESSTNEKSPSSDAISPLQNPSALATQLQIPQSYDEPQIEKYHLTLQPAMYRPPGKLLKGPLNLKDFVKPISH
ncbi:hypothetical protein DSO57_1023884 [Entomophthora muscae]|uniref:Uncharacterized protein n=1 Tax=Entomophthora muscae TaxID=34485 RepID=A0ACC2TQ62_9FUNG|nr:hypothetical protein DSO57_1023884 [Entomophthora muscae]